MSSVVILGGGIAGLSCAYYLSTLGRNVVKRITLIEKESILGGWIRSQRYPDGTVHELGPRSIRSAGPSGYNTLSLVEELGLAEEVIHVPRSHPAAQRRLILVNDQLCPLPSSLSHIFRRVPPFSRPLVFSLMKDLFARKKAAGDDECVHDFATRRFGTEVAEYLVDPFCRGIFAGSSRVLGVKAAFNTLYEAEQVHGSVVKGQIKFARESGLKDYLESDLAVKSKSEQWAMWSLRNGLQSLPESLEKYLNTHAETHINTYCSKIKFEGNHVKLCFTDVDIVADHLFACLPARALSKLLSSQCPSLAKNLSMIPTVHVAVVNLEYHGKVLNEVGFGFLVPSSQDSQVLGVTFDSCCFPAHDGKYEEKTRLTCMMGGHWFKELFGDPDSVDKDKVLSAALHAVGKHLGITQDPTRHIVSIHKNCIPQYLVGHHQKVQALYNEITSRQLPLTLLGSSYEGAGINDCIYNARKGVTRYIKSLS